MATLDVRNQSGGQPGPQHQSLASLSTAGAGTMQFDSVLQVCTWDPNYQNQGFPFLLPPVKNLTASMDISGDQTRVLVELHNAPPNHKLNLYFITGDPATIAPLQKDSAGKYYIRLPKPIHTLPEMPSGKVGDRWFLCVA